MDLCRHSVWGLPQWANSHRTTSDKHKDAAGGNPRGRRRFFALFKETCFFSMMRARWSTASQHCWAVPALTDTQGPVVCVGQGQTLHVRNQGFEHELFHERLFLPEFSVDIIKSKGSSQPLESIGVKCKAVQSLEKRFGIYWTVLLLLRCCLLNGPFEEFLNTSTRKIS